MTRRATRNIRRCAEVVSLHEICSQRVLIGVELAIQRERLIARGLLVPHVENLIAGSQIFCRIAMAIQTPLHLQRGVIEHERHTVDRAMAGIAADALVDVYAVIEINEIGQIVSPRPYQRFASAKTFAHGFEQWGAQPDLRMTIHAGFSGRNSGKRGIFHRRMTVAAVDAQSANMVLVAERHGLRTGDLGVRYIRRPLQFEHCPQQHGHEEYRPVNRGARDCVGTAVKNLHRLSVQQDAEIHPRSNAIL